MALSSFNIKHSVYIFPCRCLYLYIFFFNVGEKMYLVPNIWDHRCKLFYKLKILIQYLFVKTTFLVSPVNNHHCLCYTSIGLLN